MPTGNIAGGKGLETGRLIHISRAFSPRPAFFNPVEAKPLNHLVVD